MRLGNPRLRPLKLLALAIPGLCLAACATAGRPHTYGLAPSSAALVRKTCTDILGLPPGVPEYDACGASLADVLQRRSDSRRLEQAHESCEQQGFAEETPALARCVLTSVQADARPRADASLPGTAASTAQNIPTLPAVPGISFFSMSRSVQFDHEKLACAQLGIDPVTRDFGDCVSELTQAFFSLQNPL